MFEKYEKILGSGLKIVNLTDISIILKCKPNSARVIAMRLLKKGVLIRLRRDLYLLKNSTVSDFEIGNKLLEPSYISFESALNFWEMTTQLPEIITSAARRSKKLIVRDNEYTYSHLSKKLFSFGIVRKNNFFIACPEKSILDLIYYASLGKRSMTFDDLDTSKLDKKKFLSYLKEYPKTMKKTCKEIIPWI